MFVVLVVEPPSNHRLQPPPKAALLQALIFRFAWPLL